SGHPSLWVTNFETENHALYRNDGRASFTYRTRAAGVAAIGRSFVGFGTGFVDYDGDGWEDLVVANGHTMYRSQLGAFRQRPVLLRNLGDGRFADVTPRGGLYFRADHVGRGLAVGDLDNDGRPDLVVSHLDGPAALLRNQAPPAAWLG